MSLIRVNNQAFIDIANQEINNPQDRRKRLGSERSSSILAET